jgi:16S rRNA C1402 N4-methylase RsmH
MTEEEIPTLSHGTRFEEALPTAVRWSHALLGPRLRPGDVVVDATMGNGHDTVFLAQRVLPGGRVFAFDVQAEALEATRKRLEEMEGSKSKIQNPRKAQASRSTEEAVAEDAVSLIHAGHETMEQHLPAELRGKVRAFMFNLGWLPGAQKKGTITRTETTLSALGLAIEWIGDGGMITVVCYPGHAGGDTEADAVEA